jgi:hypothetical protein
MPKTLRETATTFVLAYLTEHSDREMQLKDLHDGCEGRFSVANMQQSLIRLLGEGKVVRNKDGKLAWWAIASSMMNAERSSGAPARPAKAAKKEPSPKKVKSAKSKVKAVPVEKSPPERKQVPATPASMTDAAKEFVLNLLQQKGVPMTLMDLLGQRQHGQKHVNVRNLKLATFYLQHEKKLRAEERDGQTVWLLA